MPFDVVIRNGTVHDGSGAPGRVTDVAIAGDTIARVGPVDDADAAAAGVVIDANVLRGTPVGGLSQIVERGFQLSVSIEALREVWVQSIREQTKSILTTRVRDVAPVIDAVDPVAFNGHAMLRMAEYNS